ncbi:hypothetical protein ABT009_22290 [Streptomyces sp. NPDC002896]|uniref:hypothetical protein n=1 Tax=Streptomyces sp. NPDC002896 TaxID=3154438 RepID=UPI0033275FE5
MPNSRTADDDHLDDVVVGPFRPGAASRTAIATGQPGEASTRTGLLPTLRERGTHG